MITIFNNLTFLNNFSKKNRYNFLRGVFFIKNHFNNDFYTYKHSLNVSCYSTLLGMQINLSEKDLLKLSLSALIHDIGKYKIPYHILMKKDNLLLSEVEIIRNHPQYGLDIIDNTLPLPVDKNTIMYHHERFDGKGYPDGLKGENIPYSARIINITDSFDAMTSKRPYKKEISQSEAIAELKNNENEQFDKYLVDSFISLLQRKECLY